MTYPVPFFNHKIDKNLFEEQQALLLLCLDRLDKKTDFLQDIEAMEAQLVENIQNSIAQFISVSIIGMCLGERYYKFKIDLKMLTDGVLKAFNILLKSIEGIKN